jgi:predicted anti-sigma-YlaC factor YlaD
MVRNALSAGLDGEDTHLSPEVVEEHLVGCAGCRDWLARPSG